jgi:hypothetical protein
MMDDRVLMGRIVFPVFSGVVLLLAFGGYQVEEKLLFLLCLITGIPSLIGSFMQFVPGGSQKGYEINACVGIILVIGFVVRIFQSGALLSSSILAGISLLIACFCIRNLMPR